MSVLAQRGGNRGSRNGNQGRRANTNTQNRGVNQGQPSNQARRQNRSPRLLRGLDLSGTQRQQIRDIRTAARENNTSRQEVGNQIRGVLTEAQTAKLDKRIEKLKAKKARKQAKRERHRQRQQQNLPPAETPPTNNP